VSTDHTDLLTRDLMHVTDELRDHIADFNDVWRPIRSTFDTHDKIDQIAEKVTGLSRGFDISISRYLDASNARSAPAAYRADDNDEDPDAGRAQLDVQVV
jgi:hypothetical protein